jgi:predicted regulator of Ras-like GTPase activity (Roadblock/LC7/MglB family)
VESTVARIFKALQAKVPGTRALVLIGADGQLIAHAADDFRFDTETFAGEHATLLRIARRTAQDTGIGTVDEHILVSDGALVIARHLPSDRFVILVSNVPEQLGRLRYELKRAAWDLEKGI